MGRGCEPRGTALHHFSGRDSRDRFSRPDLGITRRITFNNIYPQESFSEKSDSACYFTVALLSALAPVLSASALALVPIPAFARGASTATNAGATTRV